MRITALCPLLALGLLGCAGLSSEEEQKLNSHKYNSKLWYESGDFLRAEDQCLKGLALEREDPSLNLLLGWTRLRQATYPKVVSAERIFTRILDEELYLKNQGEARALLGLGSAQLWLATYFAERDPVESGRTSDLALRHLRDALRLAPDSFDTTQKMAELHMLRGELEQAAEKLDLSLKELSREAGILERQLALGGLPTERTQALQARLEGNKARRVGIHLSKANLFYKLDRVDDGLHELELVEEIAPLPANESFNRGRLLEKGGRLEEALREYELFLRTTDRPLDDFVREVIRRKAALEVRLERERTAGS
ncbi:MAG: hypothetical protein AB1486_13065 [Planctomycetota bacterium]